MRIDILTLFPEMFEGPLDHSIVKRAREAGVLDVRLLDFRDFTDDRHRTVDDSPFGGGPGMVIKPEPVFQAVENLRAGAGEPFPLIYLSPKGEKFNQPMARELAQLPRMAFLCGRYEGIDQRIVDHLVDREISIGDYVLTGGEPACAVVLDAVVRYLPGVLGDRESLDEESFSENLLEYPHYTRPAEYRGWKVPEILLSGHHEAIRTWRREMALEETRRKRPDLLRESIPSEVNHG